MTAPTATAPDYRLGPVLPHVKRAAETVGPMVGLTRILGWRATARDMLGHPAGRALDYMCTPAQGNQVVAIYQANWDALAGDYLIWQQRSWNPREGWVDMEDRGSPTQNHMDHVHAQHKVLPGSGQVTGSSTGSSTGAGSTKSSSSGADGWQGKAASIGLTLLATLAALGLVVAGASRLVTTPGRN